MDDGVVLARMSDSLVNRLAAIDPILEQVIKRPTAEPGAANLSPGLGDPAFAADAELSEFGPMATQPRPR